jgi:anti-anti-sigma regulatory factor
MTEIKVNSKMNGQTMNELTDTITTTLKNGNDFFLDLSEVEWVDLKLAGLIAYARRESILRGKKLFLDKVDRGVMYQLQLAGLSDSKNIVLRET